MLTPPPRLAPATPRPPLVGDPAREQRRAGIAAAKMLIRRRAGFHGWMQLMLLRQHPLTRCGCGLIHCR